MALPPIVIPDEILPLVTSPHSAQEEDIYANIPMQSGPSRSLRMFTTANREMSIALDVTEDQLVLFADWYEDIINHGSRSFSLQVQGFGASLVWFEAYMPSYTSEPLGATNRAQIRATVYLIGDPSEEGPDLGEFTTSVLVEFLSSATPTYPARIFTTSVSVPFVTSFGETEFTTTVQVPVLTDVLVEPRYPDTLILRQGLDYVTQDGDGLILRQSSQNYTPPEVE